jgi:acetoacetate decarboxylase
MANNTPVHAPLYPEDGVYSSSNYEAIAVLMKVDERSVSQLLADTPFEPLEGGLVWAETMIMRQASGILPYGGGGIIVPARYKDTIGGYYAFCYVDTDDSLALGREAYGYPKKYAKVTFQRTGRAATASYRRPDLLLDLSLVLDESPGRSIPDAPRFPHLLIQTIPTVDHREPLFTRVVARDTASVSRFDMILGEGAVQIAAGPMGNELEWLGQPEILGGFYVSGSFSSSGGRVLGIEQVSAELRGMI